MKMIFEPANCSEIKKAEHRREIGCMSELEVAIEESFFKGMDVYFDEIIIEPAGIQIQTHKKIYVVSVVLKGKSHRTIMGTLAE